MKIYTKTRFNFLTNSLIFSLVGIFIPVFTLAFLFMLLDLFGKIELECTIFWKTLFTLGWIGSIILPHYFYNYFKSVKSEKLNTLKTKLLFFNFSFYVSLQLSFGSLITNSNTLCYVSDGQNGLEFVFTAWLGLPVIMVFSYIFSQTSVIKPEIQLPL